MFQASQQVGQAAAAADDDYFWTGSQHLIDVEGIDERSVPSPAPGAGEGLVEHVRREDGECEADGDEDPSAKLVRRFPQTEGRDQ